LIVRHLPWVTVCLILLAVQQAAIADRRVEPFNDDWRFTKEAEPAAQQADFDDSGWQQVDLPHDWAIVGPFEPKGDGNTGKLPWRGEGWYRKRFDLPAEEAGKQVYFLFDGVMSAPQVYINGALAGEWDYGYNSFWIDATDHVKFGSENDIAVHVDTRRHASRWYPGAGIYRKVTRVIANPVHIAPWGMHITTTEVSDESATVNVRTTIENHGNQAAEVSVDVMLVAPNPARSPAAAHKTVTLTVPAAASAEVNVPLKLTNPKRWDVNDPQLYEARTAVRVGEREIRVGERTVDEVHTTFGIRTIEFTPNDGFHLNGRRVQLKGVNLHHDQGPLGAALYPRALERQLDIMQEMGVNAIRTSHNPAAPELLDFCDRMGLLVFNELFDGWDASADLHDQSQFDPFMHRNVQNFVARDRNHPCVIVWSIGNEMEDGLRLRPQAEVARNVKFVVDLFKRFDATRPVTMACHRTDFLATGILDPLDVQSWNYTRKYAAAKERYPDKPVVCSESAAAVSTRGFYSLPQPARRQDYVDDQARQISSYDLNSEWWSDVADVELARIAEDRFCAGEFVWAGFDYLGEPLPFDDEWSRKNDEGQTTLVTRSSYFGIVDFCGIPKDRYYLYRSQWAPEKLTIHILPHWNWPDRIGQRVPVFVYTNGDEAELFLNGRSLGRRQKNSRARMSGDDADYYSIVDRYRLRWDDVLYEPGELTAVAYEGGAEIGVGTRRTAGPPTALRLTPDRGTIAADGRDLCYVLVEMTDAEGTVCPLANDTVVFAVDGPACIAGVGNGSPVSLESFAGPEHALSYGKAMLVVRSRRDVAGEVVVTAKAGEIKPATARIIAE
jgi:beta-galactosidase